MPKNQNTRDESRQGRGRNRHVSIRSEMRREPDLNKIARTVIALAMAQAEKEAQAKAETSSSETEMAND